MARTPLTKALSIVVSKLQEGPKTQTEIVKETKLSWETVSKVLGMLDELDLIRRERKRRGGRIYLNKPLSLEEDTYFSVILPQEDKERIRELYGIIEEVWRKTTGEEPSPIQVQKTAVKVADELNLPIPRGRYKYGILIPLQYKEGVGRVMHIDKRIEDIIRRMAERYHREGWEIVQDHHREQDMRMYEILERIRDYIKAGLLTEALESLEELMERREVKSEGGKEMLSRLYGIIGLFKSLGKASDVLVYLTDDIREYIYRAEYYYDLRAWGLEEWRLLYLRASLEEKEALISDILEDIFKGLETYLQRA